MEPPERVQFEIAAQPLKLADTVYVILPEQQCGFRRARGFEPPDVHQFGKAIRGRPGQFQEFSPRR